MTVGCIDRLRSPHKNGLRIKPAVPGVDRSPRLGAPDRCIARSAYPSCPHHGDERRHLPPLRTHLGVEGPLPLRSRGPSTPHTYNKRTAIYWPTFTPPQWSGFTPPLTAGRWWLGCDSF